MTEPQPLSPGFGGLGIAPGILTAIDKLGFTTPTPIQQQSIPAALQGKDIIGIAQTGTGKTLAFGIPMMQHLLQAGQGNGLIVVPTRELALQVDESLRSVGTVLGFKTAVLIGGASMHLQRQMIQRRPHIIVATPGRLLDHMEQRTITLARVSVLVLDEADRMLDMGFQPQIKRILAAVPTERQTMLFSVTMPKAILSIAKQHMKLPVRVEIAPAGTAADRVVQEVFMMHREEKTQMLMTVLTEYKGSVLVFTRTKFGAKKLTTALRSASHSAAEIHSNRSLGQRKEALAGFKSGLYRVLVATDIAARGIDVTGIELVVNYDLPQNAEDYVHRIGRTGRAGREGHAISFATPDQKNDLRDIERLIRSALPVNRQVTGPSLVPERPRHMQRQHRPHGRPPHRGGQSSGHRGGHGGQRRSFGRR